MKHISEFILEISRQQLAFQSRLDAHAATLEALAESSSISTIASLPQLESDLVVLNAMHGRINDSIRSARV